MSKKNRRRLPGLRRERQPARSGEIDAVEHAGNQNRRLGPQSLLHRPERIGSPRRLDKKKS